MKVVLDTNVIVSGTLIEKGHPAKILNEWRDGRFTLVISEEIIEEVKDVLNDKELRKKYKKLTKQRVGRLINFIRRHSLIVPGKLHLEVVKEDPEDNKILTAALEGDADCIVSGDDHLLKLKRFQGIPILSPANFAKQLRRKP